MLNNVMSFLKKLFEIVLFAVLVLTIPVWIIPYTVIMKKKSKKYEKEYNAMCLGLASGFINKVNEKPKWVWKKDVEEYIETKKVKTPAKLNEYNVKHKRMSKNRNRGV